MKRYAVLLLLLACGRREAPAIAVPAEDHFAGDWSPRPAENAEVVAVVNGASIYAADVIRQAVAEHQTPAEALQALVSAELLAQEARRRGLTDDPEVVDARKRVRVRRMVEKEFLTQFRGPADVPEDEVERSLRTPANKHYFNHPEGRTIVWVRAEVPTGAPPDEDSRAQSLAKGFAALARAAAARTKDEMIGLVKLYSPKLTGGDITSGFSGLVPEFARAAFALGKPGDISDPVRTQWGWDVLLLVNIIPERRATREEAVSETRERLFDSSRREAFVRWSEAFVSRAKVYRNDALLSTIEIGEGLW